MSALEQAKQQEYATLRANQKVYKECVTSIMENKLDALKDALDKCLLELGPQYGPQDVVLGFQSEGQTLLHLAASSGHADILEYVLSLVPPEQRKRAVNQQDQRGKSPLLNATIAESAEGMRLLLAAGADVNLKNK